LNALNAYLIALKNVEKVKQGVDEIVKFRDAIPEQFQNQTNPFINGMILTELLAKKEEAAKADAGNTALKELVEYIKGKLPAGDKKGF
jgi:aminopeptidase N